MTTISWDVVTEKAKADAKIFATKQRREQIAIAAMQGLLASVGSDQPILYSDVAYDAVMAADALIAELEKVKP